MFGNIGTPEIIIILVIVLLLFGPKNLPKLAQSIGKSVRELKNGLNGLSDDVKDAMTAPPERPAAKPDPMARPVVQSDAQPVPPNNSENAPKA